MNIYLISQDVNNGYDTYDSAVVVANNEYEAKLINPSSSEDFHTWCDPSSVNVKLIGVASDGIESGIVLASFNAG